jgi:hypothetical protein
VLPLVNTMTAEKSPATPREAVRLPLAPREHSLITDIENPERFAQFASAAEAGEAAAAKPDQPAPVEHAEAPAAPPRRPLDR